jgi:hypothetical protein
VSGGRSKEQIEHFDRFLCNIIRGVSGWVERSRVLRWAVFKHRGDTPVSHYKADQFLKIRKQEFSQAASFIQTVATCRAGRFERCPKECPPLEQCSDYIIEVSVMLFCKGFCLLNITDTETNMF